MTCWKTDECPVDDPSKFTKAWKVRSAEKNPTMETHFDSEVGGYYTPFLMTTLVGTWSAPTRTVQ